MKTAKLKSVSMLGFRSFKDPTKIDFPETGICLLRGASSSGKSNVTHSIAFALDFCPKPSTVLRSNTDPEKWYATVELDLDGSTLISSRGDSASLFYDKPIPGTIAQIKSKLSEILGINTDLIKYLTYRTQRSNGMFLSLSDETKKEFLSEILSVNSFDKASETTSSNIKDLEKRLEEVQASIVTKEAQIKALRSVIGNDTPKDLEAAIAALRSSMDVVDANLAAHKASKDILDKNLFEINSKNKIEQSNANNDVQLELQKIYKAKEEVIVGGSEELKKLETEKSLIKQKHIDCKLEIDNLRDSIRTLEKTSHKVELEISTLQNTIKNAKKDVQLTGNSINVLTYSDKCAVCGQPLSPSHIKSSKSKIKELQEEIDGLELLKSKVENQLFEKSNQKVELEGEIIGLKEKLAAACTLQGELEAKYNEKYNEIKLFKEKLLEVFAIQIDNIQVEAQKTTKQRNSELFAQTKAINEKINQLKNLIEEAANKKQNILFEINDIKSQKDVCENTLAKIDVINQEIMKCNVEYADLQDRIKLENDIYSVVHKDGFPAYFFEQILDEISMEVNRLLALVPNTQNISFGFGDKVSRKGKISKTITPIVELNGIKIPFSELSGGQASSLEILCDLAVRDTIAKRAGIKFNFLILDEITTGMGKAEKDALIELLEQTVASESLVILIDHDQDFQERFQNSIEIYNENGESKVVQRT